MIGEKFIGEIQSVSAALKTVKDTDGTKIKVGVYKVKLASADIDYESMSKFNPNVSETILSIQPCPAKAINFGEQSAYKMKIDFYSEGQKELFDAENNGADAAYGNVMITNLSVKITDNIPVYTFILEIPMNYSGSFLFKNLKQRISFEFGNME
jgi:hypothetical protein